MSEKKRQVYDYELKLKPRGRIRFQITADSNDEALKIIKDSSIYKSPNVIPESLQKTRKLGWIGDVASRLRHM